MSEKDEPKRCEHDKTGPHQVRDTYALVICPGPVSQPTEGSEQ